MSIPNENPALHKPMELKAPAQAALLAWLFPGAGHLYQGRKAKGLLFMICLLPMFLAGLYMGGGRVAYASTAPLTSPKQFIGQRWEFICQAGIGAVAIPAMIERSRAIKNDPPLFGGVFRPPRTSAAAVGGEEIVSKDGANNLVKHPDEKAKWIYDFGSFFELGTVYTMIAGLMNILVVYDAYSGPLLVVEENKKEKKQEEDEAS